MGLILTSNTTCSSLWLEDRQKFFYVFFQIEKSFCNKDKSVIRIQVGVCSKCKPVCKSAHLLLLSSCASLLIEILRPHVFGIFLLGTSHAKIEIFPIWSQIKEPLKYMWTKDHIYNYFNTNTGLLIAPSNLGIAPDD